MLQAKLKCERSRRVARRHAPQLARAALRELPWRYCLTPARPFNPSGAAPTSVIDLAPALIVATHPHFSKCTARRRPVQTPASPLHGGVGCGDRRGAQILTPRAPATGTVPDRPPHAASPLATRPQLGISLRRNASRGWGHCSMSWQRCHKHGLALHRRKVRHRADHNFTIAITR